jgi:hypothetical protein
LRKFWRWVFEGYGCGFRLFEGQRHSATNIIGSPKNSPKSRVAKAKTVWAPNWQTKVSKKIVMANPDVPTHYLSSRAWAKSCDGTHPVLFHCFSLRKIVTSFSGFGLWWCLNSPSSQREQSEEQLC